jgi:hypothetical protein
MSGALMIGLDSIRFTYLAVCRGRLAIKNRMVGYHILGAASMLFAHALLFAVSTADSRRFVLRA